MAVDTPATILIIGAGPIGIEAALYARFLGYDVIVVDRGEVGENILQWGHVQMFTPFDMNSTPLGRSAIQAQDPNFSFPNAADLQSGKEYVESYLKPLAATDLVSGALRLNQTVVSMGRQRCLKGELIGADERADTQFIVLLQDQSGHESTVTADIVLDCSGVYGNANHLGPGGTPALGERAAQAQIHYGIINANGADRDTFSNQQVLVIGAGYSAATTVCQLAELARQSLETHVTWATRRGDGTSDGPMKVIEGDRLPQRKRIAQQANQLASSDEPHVTHWPETPVVALHWDAGAKQFHVTLEGGHAGVFTFDRVIANVGFRPDLEITRELQVHACYATEGPMKLAAELMQSDSADCLDTGGQGAHSLFNPEPNFYLLGAKSYGRRSNFLLQTGLDQIRQVFSIIGDREDLNLYSQPLTKHHE